MFSITDYDKRYTPTNKSGGELKNADYVKLPVKPKGDGLQTLLEKKRGLEVFAIWCLLLEKTTSQPPETRGKLLNFKDEPASIPEITKSISLKGKERLVEYALSVLVEMGWVKSTDHAEISSENFRKGDPKISKDKISKDKYNAEFENFWKSFKGRWNEDRGRYDKGSKLEAWAEWKLLTANERTLALKAAKSTGHKFTPDCCRWIKKKMWEK